MQESVADTFWAAQQVVMTKIKHNSVIIQFMVSSKEEKSPCMLLQHETAFRRSLVNVNLAEWYIRVIIYVADT